MSRPPESVLDELLSYGVPKIAGALARKFPTLEAEDVRQQCWLAVLEHKDELSEALEAKGPDLMLRDARNHAAKSVRVLRAQTSGFETDDEFYYSIGLLRAILPVYLDKGITAEPLQGRELQDVLDKSDGANGNSWLATMIDVDHAYWKLTSYQRGLLTRYFGLIRSKGGGPEWSHLDVSSSMGIPPEALHRRIQRALVAMQRHLGGESPWR